MEWILILMKWSRGSTAFSSDETNPEMAHFTVGTRSEALDLESDQVALNGCLEDAEFLWLQRELAVRAPNYGPQQLHDLDESLAAQIDVLRDDYFGSSPSLAEVLAELNDTVSFPSLVVRLHGDVTNFHLGANDQPWSADDVAIWIAALAWLPLSEAGPVIGRLIREESPAMQRAGIASVSHHRAASVEMLADKMTHDSRDVAAAAFRGAGECGHDGLLAQCIGHVEDPRASVRYRAATASVLLGDRGLGLECLSEIGVSRGPHQSAALRAALQATDVTRGHELLALLSESAVGKRLRIIGTGYVGDTRYVPWLIDQMSRPEVARIAAEAFVHLTGADFNLDQLEAMPPDDFEDGPTDDPDDDNVELPEDIALPWPDVEHIKAWWMEHRDELPAGEKRFLGKSITSDHCKHVLRTGFQRQRRIAARYLCLLEPGRPLFPTSAPAWRQQALLEKL